MSQSSLPNAGGEPFRLRTSRYADGELLVCSFRGREALSRLYRLDVVVASPFLDDTVERSVLGSLAVLSLDLGEVHRDFHGMICGVEAMGLRGAAGQRLAQHRLRLVPRAWLLGKRKGSRIFQNVRIDQVITRVLREHGLPCRFRLRHPLPVRKYCTQYSETDLEFVTRLAAENGLYFYFEQPRDFAPEGGNLATRAASAAVTGLGRAVGSLASDGPLAPLANAVSGVAGEGTATLLSGEVMVFCDSAESYPALDDDAPPPASARVANAVADELRAAGRSLLGEGTRELSNALRSAGPAGALGAEAAELAHSLAAEQLAGGPRGEAPSLHYREAGALLTPSHDSVATFGSRRGVRGSLSEYREYDPERPDAAFAARARVAGPGIVSSLVAGVRSAAPALGEALGSAVGSALGPALGSAAADTAARVGEAVGGEVAGLGEEPSSTESGTELYEHHPRDLFPDWDHSRSEPRRVLAQHRRRTEVAWGTSLCARLHAGRRFVLENHPQAFLDGERVVVRVEHRGMARPLAESERAEATYRNSFECVPASVTYVPPRPRRRVVQNCLTATVVGPSGEDIHVNSKGEIRVRFHWDRDGGGADSSCWIRTMQTWGGPGWGTQFIPRVGMEVVVSFDEGDMDRPLVLGCLYNATHPPSFALPAQKTRSGIRTQSSPLREGYNELSFEDAAEREQVYLRAQRDFDSVVERDRTAKISRDDRTRVSGEQATEVQGTQSWRLHGDRTAELDKDDHLRVQGSRHVTILHDSHERVAGSRSVRVEARERTETVGDRTSLVHGELVHEVRGAATMLVGRHDAKRSCTLAVEGVTQLTGSEVVDLASDTELVLRCGKSFIRLSPGEIEISSPKVTMRGKDARLLLQGGKAKLKAKKLVQAVSDDKIVLTSSGASLGLGSEAKLDGAQVLLNSPERATDSIEANEPELTKIELVDQEGHPIPYQRFRVELDDGSRYVGFLDEHGKAEIDVEGSGEIVFPDLAEVEEG